MENIVAAQRHMVCAAGNGRMALPVDHHHIPGILPLEPDHLQLLIPVAQMRLCTGGKAAGIGAGHSAVIHMVMPDKVHFRHIALTDLHFRFYPIRHGFLGAFDHLPDEIGKPDLYGIQPGSADAGAGMIMGCSKHDPIYRHAGGFAHRIPGRICQPILGMEQIYGTVENRLPRSVCYCNTSAVNAIQHLFAHPLGIQTVATQIGILLRCDVHPGITDQQFLFHVFLLHFL